jgi:predicted nucleic acid-binding protein
MSRVFADTQYWIALLNKKDQSHQAAWALNQALRGVTIVTTDEVLTEVLAYFCERGRLLRTRAVAFLEGVMSHPDIVVQPQSHQTFVDGFALYKARPDKGYSLTDCISMLSMRQEGISEILTRDDHFTREGFIRLL